MLIALHKRRKMVLVSVFSGYNNHSRTLLGPRYSVGLRHFVRVVRLEVALEPVPRGRRNGNVAEKSASLVSLAFRLAFLGRVDWLEHLEVVSVYVDVEAETAVA